ncbi:purple acid phosphatase family protein [Pseudotamlana agarivorans]|uniref:purple acid phosphatase family protein n=1 Tax=Pseudotamlana agarivorans TaxID=481183 RepID=UPI00082E90CE|nr:metallophosphoesterase family protein [Tamlana agarivorans]
MDLKKIIFRGLMFMLSFNGFSQLDKPEHIILTNKNNPEISQSVTWRTQDAVEEPIAQIALAKAAPYDSILEQNVSAFSEKIIDKEGDTYYYHSVNFSKLKSGAMYRYRVGSKDGIWSSWNQFRTVSNNEKPYSFIYLGDIQNDISSWGTRTIWAAHNKAPYAKFMLFAGDCVDDGQSNGQWEEWFYALGRVAQTTPILPVVGNHEYEKLKDSQVEKSLSVFWQPQFELPNNGPKGLEESVYYLDYPNMRVIVLNSLIALRSEKELKKQASWLESVLKHNKKKWTVVSFHHGVFSARDGRWGDYPELRKEWLPIFEKYKTDLILTGHDHMYCRSNNQMKSSNLKDGETGPVYVVSVAGPKMYGILEEKRWMDRAAVNSQMYQIITIDDNTLKFRTYTAVDELYDSFDLIKRKGKFNQIIEYISSDNSPENKFPNGSYTRK